MHKLTCRDILTLLNILNKGDIRGTREFSHKLITILPIHTPSIRAKEIIGILDICAQKNLQAERLINYFLIPKIENTVQNFTFSNYIALLNVLAKMKYQEDPIFWSDYILPCIFNYEMTYLEAKQLWESYLNVKINCPSLELAKYFILIENILNKFDILIKKKMDVSSVRLAIDKDYSLIPSKEQSDYSNIKIKKLQRRISEKEGKETIMRELGISVDKNSQTGESSVEGSLSKIMDIHDWKKAKFDFNITEIKRLKKEIEGIDTEEAPAEATNATVPEGSPDAATAAAAKVANPDDKSVKDTVAPVDEGKVKDNLPPEKKVSN